MQKRGGGGSISEAAKSVRVTVLMKGHKPERDAIKRPFLVSHPHHFPPLVYQQ